MKTSTPHEGKMIPVKTKLKTKDTLSSNSALPRRSILSPFQRTITASAIIIAATVFVGIIPGTFLNYGFNYYQFLPTPCIAIPLVAATALFSMRKRINEFRAIPLAVVVSIAILLPICFWLFRTRVHCFGGDGAVGVVANSNLSLSDFIPVTPFKGRLNGYLSGVFAKLCALVGLYEHCEVMPSILATAVYSIFFGCLFIWIAAMVFHKTPSLFLVIATAPFVFNFFGNIDAYSFSLTIGLLFLCSCIPAFRADKILARHLALPIFLWVLGIWTHPFHAFDGFVIAILAARIAVRWKRFEKIPDVLPVILYGIVFIVAIKVSKWGNAWFKWEFAQTPPSFSIDTFTHWFNMFFLPMVPLMTTFGIWSGVSPRFRCLVTTFLAESAVFFTMAFTLGAADQFNYQHLLFFFMMPWIIDLAARPFQHSALIPIVFCNLAFLMPMIAVHSTDATIARAEAVYPLDPCQHNRIMSWQTHLGLVLGDNLQTNPKVKSAVLRTFMDGAKNAQPPGFRGGNYIYHTAFLYHFGEFERGKKQLISILNGNPDAVRWFLSPRPGFIYCNRLRLWEDICAYFRQRRPQLAEQVENAVKNLEEEIVKTPYYVKRPSYCETE